MSTYFPPLASRIIKKKRRINPKPYLRLLDRIDQQVCLILFVFATLMANFFRKFPSNERGDMLIFVSGMDEMITLAEVYFLFLYNINISVVATWIEK
jgi:hypothetical protein